MAHIFGQKELDARVQAGPMAEAGQEWGTKAGQSTHPT